MRNCKLCVFRINNEVGDQIGCKLGRTEKFKLNTYAHDPSFFALDRNCNYYREEDWVVAHPNQDLTELVRSEQKIRINHYLYIDEWVSTSRVIESLECVVKNAPNQIYLVLDKAELDMNRIHDAVKRLDIFGKTKIRRILDPKLSDDHFKIIDHVWDANDRKSDAHYYVVWDCNNYYIPEDFAATLEKRVNGECVPTVMVMPDIGTVHGFAVLNSLHGIFGGNTKPVYVDDDTNPKYIGTLQEKVVAYATEKGELNTICRLGDLFNYDT